MSTNIFTPGCLRAAAVQAVTVAACFGWLWAGGLPGGPQSDAALLQRATALLQDNERLRGELRVSSASDIGADELLSAYGALVRRDGPAGHPALRQRLDQIAANNAELALLLGAYAPEARTAAFKPQAERFHVYALAWRERWATVAGRPPAAGGDPTVPAELPQVLQAELASL